VASYYDLLDVVPTAAADEIKRAFRREIAKYHPDKVHHLGAEFQQIAVLKAAELTQAYKTLSDASLRADYDALLKSEQAEAAGAAVPPPSPLPAPPPDREEVSEPAAHRRGATDLVRKAAVQRFRQAVSREFGACEEPPVPGFDIMCAPPKSGFLARTVPPRLLARVVDQVDAAAVQESWTMAARLKKDDHREACLFLMGAAVAPAAELGRAINEQRRRSAPSGTRVVVVPVNTRTWSAHIPTDAPPQVRAVLARLAAGV
jgi:curved DNA-binding protein CbpA